MSKRTSNLLSIAVVEPYSYTSAYVPDIKAGGNDITKKIISFSELPDGWDFGGGYAISPKVISMALRIQKIGARLGLTHDAFPEPDGGVSVAFYAEDHVIQFTVNADLSIEVIHEVGFGVEYDEVASREDVSLVVSSHILSRFNNAKKDKCALSEFSILENTAERVAGSKATHSHPSEAGYLSLIQGAQNRYQTRAYATT